MITGLAVLPISEPGMALLNVAVSLFTAAASKLIPPGTARATQLFVLAQLPSTGAFVQLWLAANADGTTAIASKAASRPVTYRRRWVVLVFMTWCLTWWGWGREY